MHALAEERPLRVLHVVEAFGGGVLEVLDALTRELTKSGYKTGIAYGVRPETPADLRARFDVDVDLLPLPWNARTLGAIVRGLIVLPAMTRRWAPDVVHLHSSFAGVAGAVLLGSSWPTVYSPHGYAFAVPRSKIAETAIVQVERLVASRVNVVAAVSQSEAEEARSRARAKRTSVVSNGIRELNSGASVDPRSEKDALVVASGRPVPQRQPAQAAQILIAVRDVASVSWIGGGYDDSPGVAALRDAEVPLSGWLPKEEALAELSRATIYLHWTAWDGLALSLLEAMARDVVVVAHDIPANREVVGPKQVCKSEEEAIQLIRRIFHDQAFRESLLEDQRQRRRNYSAEAMAEGWRDLYQTVFRDGRRTKSRPLFGKRTG